MEKTKEKLNLGPRTKYHLSRYNLPNTIEIQNYSINDLKGKLPFKSMKEIKDQLVKKGLNFKT
jgi:hypothetical protein